MKVYGWDTGNGGVFHYRIREPLRGLRTRGHETFISVALTPELKTSDVLLVRALNDEWNSRAWLGLAEIGELLLVYDLDDDIWAWHPESSEARYWSDKRRLQAEINIQIADLVTTPSHQFAKILRQLNPNVVVLPNTFPRWLTKINPPFARRPFVIGWEGAAQHLDDLKLIYVPVFRFMLKHSDVHLWLWGPERFTELPKGLRERVKCFPWQKDVPSYYRSLDMDIALAPLTDDPFNQTKSAIRVQEHSALGHPVIASPSPAYRDYLLPGQNGVYAGSEGVWEECLEELYGNEKLRRQMSNAGRRIAKAWTTEHNAPIRERVFLEAIRGRRDKDGRERGNARV